MNKKLAAGLILILLVSASSARAVEATASSGQDAYSAGNAIDGDMSTRWGSHFNDGEWWQIKFDEPRVLSGMRIAWEAAYGEKYEIQTSDDGERWHAVYAENEGDGRTDIIFFRPVKTQYVRMQGVQRGTGWGYSFWEVEFFSGQQAPTIRASSPERGRGADKIVDGNPDTAWNSEADGEQFLIIRPHQTMELGGIELQWGADYAKSYAIDAYTEKEDDWKTIYEEDNGNGARDYIYFESTPVQRLRIRCLESSASNGYALAEIKLKGGDEQATPIRHYLSVARDSKKGWFPRWLNREQEFWTAIGVVGDEQESTLGETGTFEPVKGGFSVMPFVIAEDGLIAWDDVRLEQRLEENNLPLPTARWNYGKWTLDISAVSFGEAGASSTAVRYRFKNRTSAPFNGKLGLAIRPVQLNPAWQYGGLSPIRNIECSDGEPYSLVKIDGITRIVSVTPPDTMGAAPLKSGDIVEFFAKGEVPSSTVATESDGKASGGLLYDISVPGHGIAEVVVVFPLHESAVVDAAWGDPVEHFAQVWHEQRKYWHELLNRFFISIPEQRLIDVLKSNIAYILINQDGPWIKPGPRNYAHSWMRDGSMTSVALLRMGLKEPVKKFLTAFIPMVDDKGWVPWIVHEGGHPVGFAADSREGQEYDSQGQFVFLLRQYFDFTGDTGMLNAGYPAAVRALDYGQKLRAERMTDEYKNDPEKRPYYGILPESNSHEGYYPAMHSYWDDFWYLRGLKDGAYLARVTGDTNNAPWIGAAIPEFRKTLYESILTLIQRDGLSYIPGCVEKSDFDATSTAIAVMACGEENCLPQPYARQTFDKYYDEFVARLKPGGETTFTPYEVRTADAFIRMRLRDRALTMLRYFSTDSTRPFGWNHMAEVVHGRVRTPSYIGDMPHTWVGSGFISAVRSIFVYEYEGSLILCAGMPVEWFEKGFTVNNLPTQYGLIDMRAISQGDTITLEFKGDAIPDQGFDFALPEGLEGKRIKLKGSKAEPVNGKIRFYALPATLTFSEVK
ncbi:MAG: discoidin domain-containing protein [Verrucomicrobia bacterium]|nr:discoidin domain-containing protein [Verrucomicrobiota bacterium]